MVLAHPWGRGKSSLLTPDVLAEIAESARLFGIEIDHVDHTTQERQQLRDLANDLGLAATGASDYHGSGKTRNPLGVYRTDAGVYQGIRDEIKERGGLL